MAGDGQGDGRRMMCDARHAGSKAAEQALCACAARTYGEEDNCADADRPRNALLTSALSRAESPPGDRRLVRVGDPNRLEMLQRQLVGQLLAFIRSYTTRRSQSQLLDLGAMRLGTDVSGCESVAQLRMLVLVTRNADHDSQASPGWTDVVRMIGARDVEKRVLQLPDKRYIVSMSYVLLSKW